MECEDGVYWRISCRDPSQEAVPAKYEAEYTTSETHKYLTKNNFILFPVILEYIFYVVHQMRPAFICIQLYPFVFDKAP